MVIQAHNPHTEVGGLKAQGQGSLCYILTLLKGGERPEITSCFRGYCGVYYIIIELDKDAIW